MNAEPLLLNPGWRSSLRTLLDEQVNPNPRLKNWITTVLQPDIEKNLEDYCVKLYVNNLRSTIFECYEGDHLVEIEAVVVPSRVSPSIVPDFNIVAINVHLTNEEIPLPFQGWQGQQMRVRSGVSVSITWRPPSEQVLRELTSSMYSGNTNTRLVWVYSGNGELRDLLDWAQQARIPLTATKLPVSVAKELSAKWHDQQAKRAQKTKLQSIPRGERKHIGRLKTNEGYGVPSGEVYDVYWLKDKAALEYETVLQHHCVWSYWTRVERRECAILHMRNIDPSKETDRWTVDIGAILWENKGRTPEAVEIMVRQFRGVANCDPHPAMSTGLGNMFTWSEDKNGLYEQVSPIDLLPIKKHLMQPIDIPV